MAKHYDVAVLGAGIGALTTAALLARRSWRVLVLGQRWLPPTYHYDGVSLARRAFTFLASSSPAWSRVLVELAQSQTFRRRVLPLDPMFQILAPKLRLEVPPDVQLFAKEIDRAYPEVRRVVDELYAELARTNAAADAAFEKDSRVAAGKLLGEARNGAHGRLPAAVRRRAWVAVSRGVSSGARVSSDRRHSRAVREPRGRPARFRRGAPSRCVDTRSVATRTRRGRAHRVSCRAGAGPWRRSAARRARRSRPAQARTRGWDRPRRGRRDDRRRFRGDRSHDARAARPDERLRCAATRPGRAAALGRRRMALRPFHRGSRRRTTRRPRRRSLPDSRLASSRPRRLLAARSPPTKTRVVRHRWRDSARGGGGVSRGVYDGGRPRARGGVEHDSSFFCRSSNATTSSSTRHTTRAPSGTIAPALARRSTAGRCARRAVHSTQNRWRPAGASIRRAFTVSAQNRFAALWQARSWSGRARFPRSASRASSWRRGARPE